MSNIMDCPYGHKFSKTRNGSICPKCGFDLDTPEKVYVNLRKECGLSLKEERPVCAWLVCIEGARKGKSYVISFGENFVGTDRDNEIQVLGDEKLKKRHTLIYFDEETNKGMLLPARADGIVYMDNKAVYERRILKDQDILEIGKEKFIYVAFEGKYGNLWQKCIEEIEWYKEKEKEDKKTGERLRKYSLLKKQMINEEEKLVKVSTQIDENTTKLMFLGIIKGCDIQSNGDVHELSLEIVSQSIAMEKKEHFRTFQKTITSYEEILELIVKDYDKGAFINTAQKQGTLK